MRGFFGKRILAVLVAALALGFLAQTGVSFAQAVAEKGVVKEAVPAKVGKGAGQEAKSAAAPPKPAIPPATEVEIQRRFNELKGELLDKSEKDAATLIELRREVLDDWASTVTWWLTGIAVFLVIGGFIGIKIFRDIVNDARESAKEASRIVTDARESAKAAKQIVEAMEKNRERAEDILGQLAIILSSPENDLSSQEDDSREQTVEVQEQGSKNEIIEAWRNIAKVAEGSDNDLAARAWFSIGYLLGQQEKYQEAIVACNEAIRLKPDLARAYNNRGIAKRRMGQYEDAIADFDEAIRLDSNYARAYNNRGSAKRQLNQYEDAIEDFNEAIRLKPDYAFAYNNRGNAKRQLNQYEDAIEDFNEAIRLKPDLARAYNNRGSAKRRLNQYEDAIADFDEAIRLKPDLARAYNNRGSAKRQLNQYEDAIADFDEAIRLDSDYARAYYNRGLAHLALGDQEAARSDFEKARDLAHAASNETLVTRTEQKLQELDEQ